MKKTLLVICTLLLCAGAFCESLFDYIPHLSGHYEGANGFYFEVTDDGTGYSIYNRNGHADILAVTATKTSINFYVRLRNDSTNGTARFYDIGLNSAYQFLVVLEKQFTCSGRYCFPGETNDSAINFRDKPGIAGTKAGQYQKGEQVAFTGRLEGWAAIDSAEDYWYSFDYDGWTVWMYGKYITFPDTVTLTAEMFHEPENTIADESIEKADPNDPVSKMEIEVPYCDFYWDYPRTVETFETGVSTISIENDGQGEWSNSTLTITAKNGKSILQNYPLPYTPYWKYHPGTARLYYATERKKGGTWNLSGIDCRDGSDIVFHDAFGGQKATLAKGIFDVTKAGDKLACLVSSEDGAGTELMVINLNTFTSTRYAIGPGLPVPDRLAWINGEEIFFATCEDKREYTSSHDFVFNRISLKNGSIFVTDTFRISGDFDNPDDPGSCLLLPSDEEDKLFLFLGLWDAYTKNYLLTFTPTVIRKDEVFGSGHFINQFWYEGKRYFAVYDSGDYWDDIVIYDNDLNEINWANLPIYWNYFKLDWVGVQGEKIFVTEYSDK